eukprot:TRINITY_DN22552_c0_g1_i1.p1 TRINITY_DN22552_c0_g1~~TRINITY_DN22552_c0_g1_i1.p1  ORF type:complete len:1268 (+),score=274.42 TRINITY_DN22552_c0_g1_i1:112-3915(+)
MLPRIAALYYALGLSVHYSWIAQAVRLGDDDFSTDRKFSVKEDAIVQTQPGKQVKLKVDNDISDDETTGESSQVEFGVGTGSEEDYTPRETVQKFCDFDSMKGRVEKFGNGSMRGISEKMEKKLMSDIGESLTESNVDKMAKSIFRFYVCVRWVPDRELWTVAEQEMGADILESVVEESVGPDQAIAELYQRFKFVPLLCSKDTAVYKSKSDKDDTYFTKFKEEADSLSTFLKETDNKTVWNKLQAADSIFCGGEYMNSESCELGMGARALGNRISSVFGSKPFRSADEAWSDLASLFHSFSDSSSWEDKGKEYAKWNTLFPYRSYLSVPGGADKSDSPSSSQRFLICFGQRVASEMHRRPRGTSLMTDQNNVGCHGWWTHAQVANMLSRIVEMWKPPTCQLAVMTYKIKKELLTMFQKMNENLFDALPSILHDEEMENNDDGTADPRYPPEFKVSSAKVGDTTYYDGMRVISTQDIEGAAKDNPLIPNIIESRLLKKGSLGTIVNDENGNLGVIWDQGSHEKLTLEPGSFQVMPEEYGLTSPTFLSKVAKSTKAAFNAVSSAAQALSHALSNRQNSLARFMSKAISKWVVCPVDAAANFTELDENIGTEDEAFRENVKQAYSKFTGYEKAEPGSKCSEKDSLPADTFPSCSACDFSELHANHPEKFVKSNGQEEKFICPLTPPLEAHDQLRVFKKQKGKCMLRLTENHARQAQWHYRGRWPARKQNNMQENKPEKHYELVKILDVDDKDGDDQVSYGRTCTVQEAQAHPRFCGSRELAKPWASVIDMAASVGDSLAGSVGMPVGAMRSLIANYQEIAKVHADVKNGKQAEAAKKAATMVTNQVWDSLMGMGRKMHQTAQKAEAELLYSLPGQDSRHHRLQRQIFGASPAGEFLHGMSFQDAIGASGTTSNSKDRYQRYAVHCDCADFDPAMELSLRWSAEQLALRMIREGVVHNPSLLSAKVPAVVVRGEAYLFARDGESELPGHKNSTWYHFGGAINAVSSEKIAADLSKANYDDGEQKVFSSGIPVSKKMETQEKKQAVEEDGQQDAGDKEVKEEPTEAPQEKKSSGVFGKLFKGWWRSSLVEGADGKASWRPIQDMKLAAAVGGKPLSGGAENDLRSLSVVLHCGAKKDFDNHVGRPLKKYPYDKIEDCLKAGVLSNAKMKAKEPWKLYFPDEVVVVAVFGSTDETLCALSDHEYAGGQKAELCGAGEPVAGSDKHLTDTEKHAVGGVYMGLKTGTDFPKGTVKEVILRPEDLLEVTDRLLES